MLTPADPEADPNPSTSVTPPADVHRGQEGLLEMEPLLRERLRSGKLVDEIDGARDLSIYYFDRSTTYGAGPAAGGAGASRGASATHRIGDVLLTAVSPRELAAVRATFLPPRAFQDAKRSFQEHGLVVLRGPTGSGRRAAALTLLSQVSYAGGRQATVYEMNPGMRLVDLDPAALSPHTSLLLDVGSGSALLGLTDFHLKQLQERLGDALQDNGLVLLVERLPPASGLAGLAIDWQMQWEMGRDAAQAEMLRRHVRFLGSSEPPPPELEGALASLMTAPELASLLRQPMNPGDIAELAALLLPVLKQETALSAALERRRARVDEAVRRWFAEGGHDPETMALLIAASVYNGALTEEIEAAAQSLLDRVMPPPNAAAPPPAPENPFSAGLRRTQRWTTIQADSISQPMQGAHYGAAPGIVKRLRNDAWPRAVLTFVWTEMSALRDPLIEWLEEGALRGSSRERPRAAAAVGAVALLSFPFVESRLLGRWANSADARARRAAAHVLAMTLWDDGLADASTRLLNHWATGANPRLCWTAATAHGMMARASTLAPALQDLRAIAALCVEQPALLNPLSNALVNLYGAAKDEPALRQSILEALVEWSRPPETDPRARQADTYARRRTALLSFLIMLLPAEGDPVWRLLLEDAGSAGAPAQQPAVALLRAALTFRQPRDSVRDDLHPRSVARDLLHDLLCAVAEPPDAHLAPALAGLLEALVLACRAADRSAGSTGESDLLRYYADGWTELAESAQPLRSLLLAA